MKKNRKNKTAPPPGLPLEEKQPIEEQPKKQPFLKRLLFGEETPDLSELEAGSTTILDILSPTSVDTKSRDYIVVDGIFHAYLYITGYAIPRPSAQAGWPRWSRLARASVFRSTLTSNPRRKFWRRSPSRL